MKNLGMQKVPSFVAIVTSQARKDDPKARYEESTLINAPRLSRRITCLLDVVHENSVSLLFPINQPPAESLENNDKNNLYQDLYK